MRYGLVEDKKKAIKESRGWASRYGERNPHNPYDDPERPAEDEHGNPVHESNWEHNHIHGSLARPAAPMPSDSELFEPQSARSLDRPQPVGADDSDEEFFGPDQGRGEAPGSGEAMRRQQTGGAAGASAKMKKMVTGGNSKQGKRMQQQGRERFERGEVHGYGDFDEPRSSRRRADGEEQFGSAYENTASKASSRDAVEISPDTLHHNF